jgi:hypothetical protein
MALSFPYPVRGSVDRGVGNGCTSCVYYSICPANYYNRRYNYESGRPDPHNGTSCLSWSNNPADKWTVPPNEDDLKEEEYIYNQGIGSEPNRNPDCF